MLYDDAGEALGYAEGSENKGISDVLWFVKNPFGDTVGLYSEKYQEMQMQYTYDAWGNPTIEAVYTKNSGGLSALRVINYYITAPINYRGYQYDVETGLYYVENRFYSPVLCRFINPDKHFDTGSGILGTNMYAYSDNNPIMNFDPTGEASAKNTLTGTPEKVTVSKTAIALKKGSTYKLTATTDPSTVSKGNVSWVSSNTAVATVSAKTGKEVTITAKGSGYAKITVTAQKNGIKKTAVCNVYVINSYTICRENGTAISYEHISIGASKKLYAKADTSAGNSGAVWWSFLLPSSQSFSQRAKATYTATVTGSGAPGVGTISVDSWYNAVAKKSIPVTVIKPVPNKLAYTLTEQALRFVKPSQTGSTKIPKGVYVTIKGETTQGGQAY